VESVHSFVHSAPPGGEGSRRARETVRTVFADKKIFTPLFTRIKYESHSFYLWLNSERISGRMTFLHLLTSLSTGDGCLFRPLEILSLQSMIILIRILSHVTKHNKQDKTTKTEQKQSLSKHVENNINK
jgi:hypothetical protein